MKSLVLSALALLLPTVASAQFTGIGIRGGLAMSTFSGDQLSFNTDEFSIETDYTSRSAFTVGVFSTIQISDMFAIQSELNYVSKGASLEGSTTMLGIPVEFEGEATINYIEIPLLLKLTIPTRSPLTPSVFAGPVIGLKAGKATFTSRAIFMGQPSEEEEAEDFDEDIKSSDFGVAFGAGLSFDTGRTGALVLDARYTLGLSNIVEEPENNGDDPRPELKNGTIAISVGYAFRL